MSSDPKRTDNRKKRKRGETGAHLEADHLLVVSAPIQRQRLIDERTVVIREHEEPIKMRAVENNFRDIQLVSKFNPNCVI